MSDEEPRVANDGYPSRRQVITVWTPIIVAAITAIAGVAVAVITSGSGESSNIVGGSPPSSAPSLITAPPPKPSVTVTTPKPSEPVVLSRPSLSSGEVSLSAQVLEAPSKGQFYWAIMKLTYNDGYIEYYGKGQLDATLGETQPIEFKVKDPSLKRSIAIYQVNAEIDKKLQKQLNQDLAAGNADGLTSLPCSKCNVSKSLDLTP